jgi:hypothetical protein
MLRSAEDARKLANKSVHKPDVYKAVTDLVQTKIYTAATNGLSQTTVELPYTTYKAIDLDTLKNELKKAGYGVLTGVTEGVIEANLFREVRYSITITW